MYYAHSAFDNYLTYIYRMLENRPTVSVMIFSLALQAEGNNVSIRSSNDMLHRI